MVMLTQLADVLRDAGLKVREVDGWKTRGRPASSGGFDPVGVLWHHTATGPSVSDAAVERLLIGGRSDLPGPLCNLGLERDGTWVVIAAGRANHAGTARASGSVGAGDGNALYIGVEAYNSGVGEPWPQVQLDAYDAGTAAICRHVTGNSEKTVRGHRETSVTGKIDPAGIDMDRARDRVAATITAQEDDMSQHAEQLDRIEKKIDRAAERDRKFRTEIRGRAKHIAETARAGNAQGRDIAAQLDQLLADVNEPEDVQDEPKAPAKKPAPKP